MSKGKKKGGEDKTLKAIILATALIQLIKALADLITTIINKLS